MLTDLDVSCRGMGLVIRAKKTKIMTLLVEPLPPPQPTASSTTKSQTSRYAATRS